MPPDAFRLAERLPTIRGTLGLTRRVQLPQLIRVFFINILPWIDQLQLYNAINQDLTIFGLENTTIHKISIPNYTCPSDPDAGYPHRLASRALTPYAPDPPDGRWNMTLTSYSACYGSLRVDAIPRRVGNCRVASALIAQANGVINDIAPINIAAISDGLGNTLFVAEKSVTSAVNVDALSPAADSLHGWYVSGNWGDTLMTTFYPPNPNGKVSFSATDAILNAASSQHYQGLHALMGDGSARYIKDSIQSWTFDPATGRPLGATREPAGWWTTLPMAGIWQALATRSGSELVTTQDMAEL